MCRSRKRPPRPPYGESTRSQAEEEALRTLPPGNQMDEWKVAAVTLNVNGRPPTAESAAELVSASRAAHPHVMAVSLQEVPLAEMTGAAQLTWQSALVEALSSSGHEGPLSLVAFTSLASTRLLIFARPQLLGHFAKISLRYTRTTTAKGSIGCRMKLRDGTSLVFVASHFVHGPEANDRRLQQFAENRSCAFEDVKKEVRVTVWMGDLNFRSTLSTEAMEEALRECKNDRARMKELCERVDQLAIARREGRVFSGFEEPPVHFAPTYRMHVGSAEYDLRRTPSWCDRVLIHGREVQTLRYDSNEKVQVSDHLPVEALVSLHVPHSMPSFVVDFEKMPRWRTAVPVVARFRNPHWSHRGSSRDWIGVFPSRIPDTQAPLHWVYLLTCYDAQIEDQSWTVAELPSVAAGWYRLGYFSMTASCLVGLSAPFQVID